VRYGFAIFIKLKKAWQIDSLASITEKPCQFTELWTSNSFTPVIHISFILRKKIGKYRAKSLFYVGKRNFVGIYPTDGVER
jgi:hypothetical protein